MSEQRNGLTFGLTVSLFFFHSQSIMMLLCCSFLCLRCCPFCVWHLEKCWTHSCPVSSVHKTTHASDLSSYSTHFPCLCSLSWAHTGSLALLEGSVCVKYHKHCHIFRGHSNTGTAKRCKVFFLTVTLQLSQVVTAGRIIFTNHLLIATDQNKKKRKRCRFSPLWNWCSGCYVQPIRGTDYRGLVFTDTEQQSAPAAAAQLTWAKASCFQPLTKIHKCSKQFRDNQLNQWHQYGLKTAQVRSLNCLTNKWLRTFGSTPTWPSSLSNLVTWLPSLLLS